MVDRRQVDFVQSQVDQELQSVLGEWIGNDPMVTSSDWIALILQKMMKNHNLPHTSMDEIYRSFVRAAATCIAAAIWSKRGEM